MSIIVDHGNGRKDPEQLIFPAGSNSKAVGKPFPEAWTRAIPGEEITSREFVYKASQQLVAAGFSLIPIEAYEGSKSPDNYRLPYPLDPHTGIRRQSWSTYQMRRPNEGELRGWYERDGSYGLAALGGTVSGGQYGFGLEVIDIDTWDLSEPWMDAVEQQVPGLVNRLVRVRTPRPGLHVYYRCARYGVNQKLAYAVAKDDYGKIAVDASGRALRKTLIEIKAEGGYCLIPPSPARCHPTNRLYQYVDGSPTLIDVPTITPEERIVLLKTAQGLNQWQEPEVAPRTMKPRSKQSVLQRPGDDFNARADWSDILTKHGWTKVGVNGEECRWCRPGKKEGISATTNHNNGDLLYVFTTNAPKLDGSRCYTKFTAYTFLNHEGNFEEAARELKQQGFGAKTLKAGKR